MNPVAILLSRLAPVVFHKETTSACSSPDYAINSGALAVTALEFVGDRVTILVRVTNSIACCPQCQIPLRRVNSHYTRSFTCLGLEFRQLSGRVSALPLS